MSDQTAPDRTFTFPPDILREYDIRGVVGRDLTEETAYHVGRSLGTLIVEAGGQTACTGYDGRLSSPALEAAAARGLADCGLEVWQVGLGPTPMLYYAVHARDAGGGLMVTGSHNPPDYNGFKMLLGKTAIHGDVIRRFATLAAQGAYASGHGAALGQPVEAGYIDRLVAEFSPDARGLKVAWDAGNGAAGRVMRAVADRLPGHHVLLFDDIDGAFPNHHPDPTVEANLVDLKAAVARDGCDIGIAFDGDGDRIGIVDGQGRVLWGDQILLLLAREVLETTPGATILADVKASQVLFDEVARLGGQPLMWKTGHSLVKAKMKETGAPLGGEMSGHIFCADRYYGFDDALYVAVRMLSLLGRQSKPLSRLRDEMPAPVSTPEVRFDCPDARKFEVIEQVRADLTAARADMSEVDGVRVRTADGWWLLRASNTQPVLVARCEADDAAGLDRLKAAVVAALAPAGLTPPDDF